MVEGGGGGTTGAHNALLNFGNDVVHFVKMHSKICLVTNIKSKITDISLKPRARVLSIFVVNLHW